MCSYWGPGPSNCTFMERSPRFWRLQPVANWTVGRNSGAERARVRPSEPAPARASPRPPGRPSCRADTRVHVAQPDAILSAMSTDSHRIPAKPTLDGLEDKWTQRWAKERVVQV